MWELYVLLIGSDDTNWMIFIFSLLLNMNLLTDLQYNAVSEFCWQVTVQLTPKGFLSVMYLLLLQQKMED